MARVDFNITKLANDAFQVRIVKKGIEYSKSFAWSYWNGEAQALEAAQSWRDQMRSKLGLSQKKVRRVFNEKPFSNKGTTGVLGVTRYWNYDRRREKHYLRYGVNYRVNGKAKTKSFDVGSREHYSADMDFHAMRTAIRFRHEYEYCQEVGIPFDASRFKHWRARRLYEEPAVWAQHVISQEIPLPQDDSANKPWEKAGLEVA